eukprot:563474-Pyramimonas_sp.AAC.1
MKGLKFTRVYSSARWKRNCHCCKRRSGHFARDCRNKRADIEARELYALDETPAEAVDKDMALA